MQKSIRGVQSAVNIDIVNLAIVANYIIFTKQSSIVSIAESFHLCAHNNLTAIITCINKAISKQFSLSDLTYVKAYEYRWVCRPANVQ